MKNEERIKELDYLTDCLLYVSLWLSDLDDVTDPIERAKVEKGILSKIKKQTDRDFRERVFADVMSEYLVEIGALD